MELAFPVARRPVPTPPIDGQVAARGLSLVRAGAGDLAFLRALFADMRAQEMLLARWTEPARQAFLDDQFRLQHVHFVRHFAAADFWIVCRTAPPAAPGPIGRLYLDRSAPWWRIVDIGLLAQARGGGIGAALLEWAQRSCGGAGASGIDLNVAITNGRARRLYERLGFAAAGDEANMHLPMRWTVPAVPPAATADPAANRAFS